MKYKKEIEIIFAVIVGSICLVALAMAAHEALNNYSDMRQQLRYDLCKSLTIDNSRCGGLK